jgi:hypothetical protein
MTVEQRMRTALLDCICRWAASHRDLVPLPALPSACTHSTTIMAVSQEHVRVAPPLREQWGCFASEAPC